MKAPSGERTTGNDSGGSGGGTRAHFLKPLNFFFMLSLPVLSFSCLSLFQLASQRERRRRTGKREHFRRQVVARKGRCLHINAMQKGQPASTTTSSPLSPFMECKCAKWSRRRSSSRNQTSETGTEKERKKERDIGKRWIATLWPGLSDLIPTHLVSLRFGLDSIHGCIPVRPYGSLFFFYLTK